MLSSLLSLRLTPIYGTTALWALGTGFGFMSMRSGFLLFLFGCATSFIISKLSPILTLRPSGGSYNVGIKEFPAQRSTGTPPMTVFYPTTESIEEPMPWLPFNDISYFKGMADYVHMPWVLLYDMQFTKVMAKANAKATLLDEKGKPRQLILFSHGLSGYGRLYSILLMNLAARGAIVAAVDHMDRSAAFCRDETNSFRVELDTTKEWKREDREPQLEQRVKELQVSLKRLTKSKEVWESLSGSNEVAEKFTTGEMPVALVGHSFGGASVLATAYSEQTKQYGKVSAVVGLDPWHIPLDGPLLYDPIEKGTHRYTIPTLLFHSQAWYIWKESWEFFEKLNKTVLSQKFSKEETKKLEEAASKTKSTAYSGWYNTLKTAGAGHLTYTDVALLSPIVFRKPYMTPTPEPLIVNWANDTLNFASLQSNPLSVPPPPPEGW